MRLLRILLIGFAVLPAVLGLLVILIPWYVQTERFRAQIEAEGTQAFGRRLTIGGEIALRPSLSPRITVEDIRVGNPDWASRPSLLTARRLELQVDLLALLGGELDVLDVVFEGADLLLERRADGKDNFTFKRGGGVVLISDLDNMQLRDTVFAFRSGGETRFRLELLDSRSRVVTGEPEQAEGRGRFRGVEFDFSIRGETTYMPGQAMGAWAMELRSRAPDLNLDVNVRVANPTRWEGVAYHVEAEGRATEPLRRLTEVNLPELGEYKVSGNILLEDTGFRLSELSGLIRLTEDAPAIQVSAGEGRVVREKGLDLNLAGLVDDRPLEMTFRGSPPTVEDGTETRPFRIELRSGERRLTAEGSYGIRGDGPALSAHLQSEGPDFGLWEPWLGRALPQIPFSASTQLRYDQQSALLEGLEAKVGDLRLAGDLRYTSTGPRPHVSGKLRTSAVDLAQFPGAGGEASLDAPIETAWLTALDTDIGLSADAVSFSGATFRNVKLTSILEAGRLRLEGVKATVADSALTASAELWSEPRGLVIRANASARKLDLEKLSRELKAKSSLSGRLERTSLEFSAQGHTRRELLTGAELTLTVAPSKVEYRHARARAPRVIEVDSLRAGASPGGPLTVEAETRVADRPFAVTLKSHTLVGFASRPERWPLRLDITGRNATLEAVGTAARPWAGRGFDLRLTLSGERFQRAALAINLFVPLKGQFEFTGRFHDQKGRYLLSDFTGRVGQSRLSGNITLDLEDGRPRVTADVRSRHLHITDYTVAIHEDEPQAKVKRRDRVIPEFEVPVQVLRAFDLDLKLRVDELVTPTATVGGFLSDIQLRNGLLTVSDSLARGVGGATLKFDFRLDARLTPPYIVLEMKAQNVDYGRMLGHLELTDLLEGRMDLDFRLSGHGATRDSFLRRSNGHLVLIGGEGKIASQKLDLWAGDLTRVMLSTRWERKRETHINCINLRVDVLNGLATVRALLFDTTDVTMGGSGTLDLPTEAIDLVLQPAPKEPSLVSLATPARIQGTLRHPKVSRAQLPTQRRASMASGLLAGLVNPAFLVLSFSHMGEGEKNACVAAMDAAKTKFDKAK